MSYFLPKRISELAAIDPDLDTPDKRPETSALKNSWRFPRRTAEIDLQDSESDDEKNDSLNCAILNDSFVLSPGKKFEFDNTNKELEFSEDENNKNVVNSANKDSGIQTKCISHPIVENIQPVEDALEIAYRPIKSRTQLFASKTLLQDKPQETSVPSVFQKSESLPDPRNNEQVKVLESSLKQVDIDTPFKKTEHHMFATPSLRPQYFCAPTIKKCSNLPLQQLTCERKDKPQAKILFTTPVARPPLGNLVEHTPSDSRKAPLINHRKLSPIKEPSSEKEKPNEQTITINNIDYIIDKKIGSGGSSSVYLARGSKTGSECAIKLVNLDGDQQVIDGYLNETKLLAKLQGNISVVRLFDYCHLPEKGILYMVMEKGESDLHKTLQAYRTHIPLYTLMSYWHQMLQAVNYIHMNGVIHSDLKPANFLMIGGRLKLIDFGIASNIAIDSTSIIKFSQAGTFNYISPEALIDTSNCDSPSTHHQPRIRLSTKSDVWSLGCIFYLLLFKKTPFSHIKVIHQKITALTNPNTTVEYPELPNFYPPILVEMVKKCLIYNPKQRSSVADLLKYPFEMIIPIEK